MNPKHDEVRKVKAWAIVNIDAGMPDTNETRIWGEGGVAVAPIQVFRCEKWAEFTRNLPEHSDEVAKGTTRIVPCVITYPALKDS